EGHQDALRPRRRQRAHARRSRPVVRGHTRTYPADRGKGAAEVKASVAFAEVAGVYGWSKRLAVSTNHVGTAASAVQPSASSAAKRKPRSGERGFFLSRDPQTSAAS